LYKYDRSNEETKRVHCLYRFLNHESCIIGISLGKQAALSVTILARWENSDSHYCNDTTIHGNVITLHEKESYHRFQKT